MGEVVAKGDAPMSALARRVTRLDAINSRLTGLKRDYTQLLIQQVQEKANIYNANMHVSHGERQGIVSASTSQIATEVLQIKGEIEVLEEEQAHLRFLTQWVED